MQEHSLTQKWHRMPEGNDKKREPATGVEYRRFTRGDVDITIDVRESAGGRHKAQMVDLSLSGCRIFSVTYLSEDRRIFITLPGFGPLEAEVVWRIKDEYGCSFINGLHPAIYDHIVAKVPSLGGR
jgi:PilZ domain